MTLTHVCGTNSHNWWAKGLPGVGVVKIFCDSDSSGWKSFRLRFLDSDSTTLAPNPTNVEVICCLCSYDSLWMSTNTCCKRKVHIFRSVKPWLILCLLSFQTTKYTFFSFVPKNLFEQFHRWGNFYFLLLIILNWVPFINAFAREVSVLRFLVWRFKRTKMVDYMMNGTCAQMKRRADDREEWRRDVMRDLTQGRLPLMMMASRDWAWL